ncbi:MAG: 3-5 exoribonuclease [Thermotoga sp.]|nr:3-5 exoribonuclease [Thermotoga sp.]
MPKDLLGQELFVQDLKDHINNSVEIVLKIRSKKLQETKDSKKFLIMTLEDRTGAVRAVDWYNAELNDQRLKEGSVVKVKGRVVFFENRIQINVENDYNAIRVLKKDEYDFSKFVAQSKKDPEVMKKKLFSLIDQIRDRDYKKLLRAFFVEDEEFSEKFFKSPAGMRVHHAYIGGLLEHSLTVAEICREISKYYPLDRDLLITGALLHDVGKVREYVVTESGIDVTTEGELKGHISIGAMMVREKAKELGLPEKKVLEVEHIILSHHGELEWGSPVVPKTIEALIVHHVENLDSKLARFFEIIENADSDQVWTEYDKNLKRRIFIRGEELNE